MERVFGHPATPSNCHVWALAIPRSSTVLVVDEAVLDALGHIAAMRALEELKVPQHADQHPEGLALSI